MSTSPPWHRHLRPSLAQVSVYDVPPRPARARLNANELGLPWPEEIRRSLAARVADIELQRYPDTSGRSLRAVLAARHGVSADRIVLGNGSDEVISFLLVALSGNAAKVVVPSPSFVMYAHSARVVGCEVVEVALDDEFQLDEAAMGAALAHAALCFLALPNNPTSSHFSPKVVERLIAAHPQTVFVLDEAYGDFSDVPSLFRADGPDNVVLLRTLSKIGLAALRVGYCVAPPSLAHDLDKVRHPYNLDSISLMLAETCLTEHGAVLDGLIAQGRRLRGRLVEILSTIPSARVLPAHANFVVVSLGDDARARAMVDGLAARGVLVKDATQMPAMHGCVRVSVGSDEELGALADALDELALASE